MASLKRLTLADAVEHLGIAERTAWRYCQEGIIKAEHVNRRWWVDADALHAAYEPVVSQQRFSRSWEVGGLPTRAGNGPKHARYECRPRAS